MYKRDDKRKDLEIIITLFNDAINKYGLEGLSEEQKKVLTLFKDPNIYHLFLFQPNPTIILEGRGQIMGFAMMKVGTENFGLEIHEIEHVPFNEVRMEKEI